jgi:hypothetical protein
MHVNVNATLIAIGPVDPLLRSRRRCRSPHGIVQVQVHGHDHVDDSQYLYGAQGWSPSGEPLYSARWPDLVGANGTLKRVPNIA